MNIILKHSSKTIDWFLVKHPNFNVLDQSRLLIFTPQKSRQLSKTHNFKKTCESCSECPALCNPMNYSLPGSSVHGDSPGRNIVTGCHALFQGIFPTQGLNPGVLHHSQILYPQSHTGSRSILEWVTNPFSRESSCPDPGIELVSPELHVDSLPAELPGKPLKIHITVKILEIIFSRLICVNIVFPDITIKGHILFSLWMVVFTLWQIFFFFFF